MMRPTERRPMASEPKKGCGCNKSNPVVAAVTEKKAEEKPEKGKKIKLM